RIHAGWNVHGERLVFLNTPPALAIAARVADHLAHAAAMGAGLLHGEKALLHAHLTQTAAGGAGFRLATLGGTGAIARLAGFQSGDADIGFGAPDRFLQGDGQVITQVRTPSGPASAPATE